MNGVLADPAAFNKKVRLFWIGSGTGETAIHEAASQLDKALEAAGIKHVAFVSRHVARVADLAPQPQ